MMIEFKKPRVTAETVTLMRDGNQIVALLGPDLQAGYRRLRRYGG
jgi:hypothetical protein